MPIETTLATAALNAPPPPSTFQLGEVFYASPVIYTLLMALSVAAAAIWLYTLLTLKRSEMMPDAFTHTLRTLLSEKRFESALETCRTENNFASVIIASGLSARKHGPQVMLENMQSEGRRAGGRLWQRIALLSEIATIAPMLGLLGTVLGLFFAFYDSARSAESIASIFDGLGIAVGTTVAGLIVAILAMLFYTSLKYRAVNVLNQIENESLALVTLVETEKTP